MLNKKYIVVCSCSLSCPDHKFEKETDALNHAKNREDYPQVVYKEIYRTEASDEPSQN